MARKRNFFTPSNDIFEFGLNPFQLSVYFYLARCANNAKEEAFPSYATIAEKTGMSERKAKNVVKELVSAGFIKKQRRWGERGGQSNVYVVEDPLTVELDGARGVKSDTPNMKNSEESSNGKGSGHILGTQSYTPQTVKSAYDALNGVHDMHSPSARGAQYKELYINNKDYKEKTYIDFDKIDDHSYFQIYNSVYKERFDKNHPRITEDQLRRLEVDICDLIECDISDEEFEEAARNHLFNLPPKNDGKIFPFIEAWKRHFEV
ncbi:helix-turn-helix domain-containing protein [Paenibacillus woosongensis]|uniref:Helix-turn-helix domain-containing protein n=1 Tax=Paenibacillus woosongensis TaxID=307580 RepID=A0A7X2YYK5_9BACL|nr:helix-turn-helix domain-containing protein [Paenibacillus woosongensis]MUG43444.1 hypothetical protein [Paenibacillus woosongensis]